MILRFCIDWDCVESAACFMHLHSRLNVFLPCQVLGAFSLSEAAGWWYYGAFCGSALHSIMFPGHDPLDQSMSERVKRTWTSPLCSKTLEHAKLLTHLVKIIERYRELYKNGLVLIFILEYTWNEAKCNMCLLEDREVLFVFKWPEIVWCLLFWIVGICEELLT